MTDQDAIREDWDTRKRAPHTPILHLDGFDGPIDLLLDLAERQRIDLGALSILALAEQFAAELATRLQHLPLDRRADWIVLACHLLLLRSRLLCAPTPADAASAERDSHAELARVEAMLHLRATAAWLDARPQLGRDVFARPSRGADPRATSYMVLMEACLVLLRSTAGPPTPADAPYRPAPLPLFRVADAIARIQARLHTHPDGGDLVAFLPRLPADAADHAARCRQAVATTLTASLELARHRSIHLQQHTAFGPIVLRHAKAPDNTAS